MNLFELLAFISAIGLSLLFGRCLYAYIGWWAVLPGALSGAGVMAVLLLLVRKFLPRPTRRR